MITGPRVDRNCQAFTASPQQAIKLGSGCRVRRPVTQLIKQFVDFTLRSQKAQNPAFKQGSAHLRCGRPSLSLGGGNQARINKAEFRMSLLTHPEPGLEGGKANSKKSVLQNFQITLRRGSCDTTVARPRL